MLNSGKIGVKGQGSLRGVDGSSDETTNRTRDQVVHQTRRVILYHESSPSNFPRVANGMDRPPTFGFGSMALTWWMQPKYPPFHQKCLKTSEYRSKRGDNMDTHLHMVASIPAYKPMSATRASVITRSIARALDVPSGPSLFTTFLTTSIGPAYVLALSCNLCAPGELGQLEPNRHDVRART